MSYVTTSSPGMVPLYPGSSTQLKQLQIRLFKATTAVYNLREFATTLNTRPSILIDWINEYYKFKAVEPPERRGRASTRSETADYFTRVTPTQLSYAIESVIRKFILCPKCQDFSAACGCAPDAPEQKHSNCHCDSCDLIVLGTRSSCCWCIDTRSNEEINDIEVRLDAHGFVKPADYYIYWPIDAAYCSACRTCPPTSRLYANLTSAVVAFNAVR